MQFPNWDKRQCTVVSLETTKVRMEIFRHSPMSIFFYFLLYSPNLTPMSHFSPFKPKKSDLHKKHCTWLYTIVTISAKTSIHGALSVNFPITRESGEIIQGGGVSPNSQYTRMGKHWKPVKRNIRWHVQTRIGGAIGSRYKKKLLTKFQ